MDPMQPLAQMPSQLGSKDSLFRQVFELTSDAFFLLKRLPDGGWTYEEVNRITEAFLHATADQLCGRPLDEVLPPELAVYFAHRCAQCIEQGGPFTYDEEVDLPIGRSYFSTSLIPLRDRNDEITRIAGVCRDVTERRREEETRRESQKLESLGVMAGGIAHDFNNLLTIAMGNLGLIQSHLTPERPEYPYLVSLEEALHKGADLTRQILAYAGRGRMVVRAVDLTKTLRGMANLMAASIPKKIRLEYHLQEDLPNLETDSSQIQQVIMSLVMNASEAIGAEVGTVTLRTAQTALDEAQLRTLLPGQQVPPGPLVILEVNDTGPGIDPQILPRIFDPFFTTKAVGRGLGLSAIQGILRSQRAGIQVLTQLHKGTTFKLYFPASTSPLSDELPSLPERALGRIGNVLFVDDEPEILAVGETILQAMKLQVTLARDGLEAVELFRSDPEAIDLVILDVSMPRMDGKEAFRILREIRPVPVLFCSGYSKEEIPAQFLNSGDVAFLNKPYRVRELQEAISRLMNLAPEE